MQKKLLGLTLSIDQHAQLTTTEEKNIFNWLIENLELITNYKIMSMES